MSASSKVNGIWKTAVEIKSKVNNTWRTVVSGYRKESGVWKAFYRIIYPYVAPTFSAYVASATYPANDYSNSRTYFAKSTNGTTWTNILAPKQNINSILFGNGRYVAIESYADSASIISSTDGVNWASSPLPSNEFWNEGAYGNGIFVIIKTAGSGYTPTNAGVMSTNGTSWTSITLPVSGTSWQIAYGYGARRFVAVSSEGYSVYSSNGIDWTLSTVTPADIGAKLGRIAYGGNKFVMVGEYSNYACYSLDGGETWIRYTLPVDLRNKVLFIAYSPDLSMFLVGRYGGYGTTSFWYSSDGINWLFDTNIVSGLNIDISSLSFVNKKFVVSGPSLDVGIARITGTTWPQLNGSSWVVSNLNIATPSGYFFNQVTDIGG